MNDNQHGNMENFQYLKNVYFHSNESKIQCTVKWNLNQIFYETRQIAAKNFLEEWDAMNTNGPCEETLEGRRQHFLLKSRSNIKVQSLRWGDQDKVSHQPCHRRDPKVDLHRHSPSEGRQGGFAGPWEGEGILKLRYWENCFWPEYLCP